MIDKPEIMLNTAQSPFTKEGVELSKNSRGVTWRIRIVAGAEAKDKLTQEDLDRLENLHKNFLKKYKCSNRTKNKENQDNGDNEEEF